MGKCEIPRDDFNLLRAIRKGQNMFDCELQLETPLDAIDALDQLPSSLRGLGFMSIALCEETSVADEHVFGLIADIVYQCADVGERASEIICANVRKDDCHIDLHGSTQPEEPLVEQPACAA